MPDLLLLTLLPTNPTSAADFAYDLTGLTIEAFELTVKDGQKGRSLGTASGTPEKLNARLEILPGAPLHLKTPILQYYEEIPRGPVDPPIIPPNLPTYNAFSVATAVVIVDLPDNYGEYDTFDIRVELRRRLDPTSADQPIGKQTIEFNVPVYSYDDRELPVSPATYHEKTDEENLRATYIFIPPKPKLEEGGDPSTRFVRVGPDDQTPVFETLVAMVNDVLSQDNDEGGSGTGKTSLEERLKPLTAGEATHVAREIIYDHKRIPLPEPQKASLKDMYTGPINDDQKDQPRKLFEGKLAEYRATHEAEASDLARYIFAASCAVWCERLSRQAKTAGFPVPLEKNMDIKNATAILTVPLKGEVKTENSDGTLDPQFVVPAAYFYVLGAILPTTFSADDRFSDAIITSEEILYKALRTAWNAGNLKDTERPRTGTVKPELNFAQAARRTHSLGYSVTSIGFVTLDDEVSPLVVDWLAYSGETETINVNFWADELGETRNPLRTGEYLEILLRVIADDKPKLMEGIKDNLHVVKASDLLTITDRGWRDFFTEDREDMLPSFTEPGNLEQKTGAFITRLKKLFAIAAYFEKTEAPDPGEIPSLGGSGNDALSRFLASYTNGFSFNDPLPDDIEANLNTTFPDNPKLREWTWRAVETIHFLYTATADPSNPDLQFSYMEALYSRGLISANRCKLLTGDQFQAALAGTVAYPSTVSSKIYKVAIVGGESPPWESEPAVGFTAVNPGDIVDCVPPENLSPLGKVEYLHEMLQLTIGDRRLQDIITSRRGPLGDLKASMANLETPIPAIDLVNESLEALGSDLVQKRGAVRDTNGKELFEFTLGDAKNGFDAATMYDAIPDHSAPAFKVKSPEVYDVLKKDFSTPNLPYNKDLDLNQSYLKIIGTSRYDAMRHWRKDITEFVLDPGHEPDGFLSHLWRFPVRLDIALEYLGITPAEMSKLYTQALDNNSLGEVLGFKTIPNADGDDPAWIYDIRRLPVFLEHLGLSYCEFLELWKCGPVCFTRERTDLKLVSAEAKAIPTPEEDAPSETDTPKRVTSSLEFPLCEPCEMESMRILFRRKFDDLREIVVFVRLWKTLQRRHGEGCISACLLAAVCEVLQLFLPGETLELNPDFIRQLAALMMLCDFYCLPLEEAIRCETPEDVEKNKPWLRVPLLSLWAGESTPKWGWAVHMLLDAVEMYTKRVRVCPPRSAEFRKIMEDNLLRLSQLAGFTKDHPWNSNPSCTLRFVEVLSKIYASDFSVGEILFMFSNGPHLLGDDPFPSTEASESIEDPLNFPEDSTEGLWKLRAQLLEVSIDDCDADAWNWRRVEKVLRREFGVIPSKSGEDPLRVLGEHFFSHMLESHGHRVSLAERQFSTQLSAQATTATMWSSVSCGVFHYQSPILWAELPIQDNEVLKTLLELRPLNEAEQMAIRCLYFAPRKALAPFAHIFENFNSAVDMLVQEPDESCRWRFFQHNFALFYRRCEIIAEHLAEHVHHATGCDGNKFSERCGKDVAWTVLKDLFGDENRPSEPWEHNSGRVPDEKSFLWDTKVSGTSFAALLGLTGVGLVGEFNITTEGDESLLWRDIFGPMSVFGRTRNRKNVPVPTILPPLEIRPSTEQRNQVVFRNGLAIRDVNAEMLGGAATCVVEWNGVLLVEKPGQYSFHVRRPELHCSHESEDHQHPKYSHQDHHGAHAHEGSKHQHHEHHDKCDDEVRWVVMIRRGQRSWTLLNHEWRRDHQHHAPSHESLPVHLIRGGYEIEIRYERAGLEFVDYNQMHPAHTGLDVLYCGPDTEDETVAIPVDKLFPKKKDNRLSNGLSTPEYQTPMHSESAAEVPDEIYCPHDYLNHRYYSTLTDIRRTYQRAFKAILFAHRFNLCARPNEYCHGWSELGFFLGHAHNFVGTSYYLESKDEGSQKYLTHRADFNFNLLPVFDAYCPPDPPNDSRTDPSSQRCSAMFDWWERMYDYVYLRHQVKLCLKEKHHPRGPIWRLFHEADVQNPEDAKGLVSHLGVDISHAPLVLRYFNQANVDTADFVDERWTIRLWHAKCLLDEIQEAFFTKSLEQARPDRWVASEPGSSENTNLMKFVFDSCLRDSNVPRFQEVEGVDNSLRERARKALLSFLCVIDRVALPYPEVKPSATVPQDLSDLLLQDVEVWLDDHVTRIEDGIRTVHTFVQRIRVGLEPAYALPPGFGRLWDNIFCNFEKWQSFQRRRIYKENWIHWEEMQKCLGSEAFEFFESMLKQTVASIPRSSPPLEWSSLSNADPRTAVLPGMGNLQAVDYLVEGVQKLALDEGIRLMGTPERHAQPTMLAAVDLPAMAVIPNPEGDDGDDDGGSGPLGPKSIAKSSVAPPAQYPLWFQAAVKMGTRFIRVAAAGLPPAMYSLFEEPATPDSCKCCCGKDHPPVIDEYYFWLVDARRFDDIKQDADVGSKKDTDPTSDWDNPGQKKILLQWPAKPLVHLAWTRVHSGEFQPPRRSDEGIEVTSYGDVKLGFKGRHADSLKFTNNGVDRFRYDISTDSVKVIPQVVEDKMTDQVYPAPLPAFPFFVFFEPGAPLAPTSSFATTFAVAGALRTKCCFEEALKWCRSAYDPLGRNNSWTNSRARLRARDSRAVASSRLEEPKPLSTDYETDSGLARARAVVLEYLDNILQWGDALMCKNTAESIQQAFVLFNEAGRILGSRPIRVNSQNSSLGDEMKLSEFSALDPPLNPRLMCLYDQVVDRRKMLHGQISAQRLRNGHLRGTGKSPVCGCGASPSDFCGDVNCTGCCLPFRFSALFPKAMELAGAVKNLGSALMAAYEKGDAEYLGALRQAQERQILDLNLEVKQYSFREADWQVHALAKQMEGAQTRLRYNQQLIKAGLISDERAYRSQTKTSMASRTAGNVQEGIGQAMQYIPDMSFGGAGVSGSPLQFNHLPLGTKLSGVFQAAARIMNVLSEIASTNAGLSNTNAGWTRREDEWKQQVDIITLEMAQIKRQKLAAERRRDIGLRDVNNHQRQMEHSAEVSDFLRDKLTRHSLYLFLQQETAGLYRQTYDMALQTAKEALAAFRYERRDLTIADLPASRWDNLHEGLMAGENLEHSLHTLNRLYMRTNCREHELQKHFSLRLHFPQAFLQLICTGVCEFEIPEWMFDLDYPGHYMRRIKNVSLTVPAIVGPYVGVHCFLQQLSSGIRLSPELCGPSSVCCNGTKPTTPKCSYDAFHLLSRQYIGSEAIATSSGQTDAGIFELSFRDERFSPFEFSGTVSRWRVELPPQNNAFDLDAVSDVVLHINYTARYGGPVLRQAAEQAAQNHLPGGGVRFFDLRHEFPDSWRTVFAPPKRQHHHPAARTDFAIEFRRRMFPFLVGGRSVVVTSLDLFIEPAAVMEVEAAGCCEADTEESLLPDHLLLEYKHEMCEPCKKQPLVCVLQDGWYHGRIEGLQLGPVLGEKMLDAGRLRWPKDGCEVRNVYLLVGWRAVEKRRGKGVAGVAGRVGGVGVVRKGEE